MNRLPMLKQRTRREISRRGRISRLHLHVLGRQDSPLDLDGEIDGANACHATPAYAHLKRTGHQQYH